MTISNSPSAPTAGWELRAARADDLESVERLVLSCALPADGIADHFDDNYAVVCAHGELLGVAGVEVCGVDGLLRSVAVDSAQRGKGIAAVLVQDRIAWARRNRLQALYLLTTTAEGYFATQGFNAVARAEVPDAVRESSEFATTCPESAVVMYRPL